MSTIFISHSSHDRAAANALLQQLEAWHYVDPFLSSDGDTGILVGSDWMAALDAALKRCKALVFLCSDHSMQSAWCLAELVQAHGGGKFVAPVVVAPYDRDRALAPLQKLVAERQVADLTSGGDGYERLRKALAANGIDPIDDFPWDPRRAPYPGMLAFDEADAAIYFGRGPEIDQLLDRLGRIRVRETRLAVVLGESGCGKSSFVRAGVLPRLCKDRERWVIVPTFRPKDAPIAELARALADGFATHGRAVDWQALRVRLEAATPEAAAALVDLAMDLASAAGHREASVLLVVDQLEELLAPGREAQADGFLRLLRGAFDRPGNPLLALTTLRSDFFSALQRQPALEGLPREAFPLTDMPADRVRQVIEGPAACVDIEIEEGLVDRMEHDMGGVDALPILAFTLRELYTRCRDDRRLTLRAYDEIGGVRGAVAKSLADTVHLDRLGAEEQRALRRAFLDHLSTLSEDDQHLTRRRATWEEIPVAARPVLETLVAARLLVRTADTDDRGIVEVAHEALFRTWDTLANWVREDLEFLLWRRRLRDRVETGEVLRGGELRRACRYREQHPKRLSPEERGLIHGSVVAQWRRRAWAATPLLGVLVLALVGLRYYDRWRRAHDLASAAETTLAANPQESVRLAAAAVAEWEAEDLWGVLRKALRESHMRVVLPPPTSRSPARPSTSGSRAVPPQTKMNFAAFGPDDHIVITASSDKTARVWEIDWHALDPTRPRPQEPNTEPVRLVAELPPQSSAIQRAALSPGATRLLTVAGDTVTVWREETDATIGTPDAEERQQLVVVAELAHSAPVTSAVFGCDRALVLTGDKQGKARLWHPASNAVVPLDGHSGAITSAVFDRDCTRIVTASEDGTARVWEPSTGRQIATLSGHKASVVSARFSPDGRQVVTASSDNTAAIWDSQSGQQVGKPFKHKAALRDARFSPDGHRLVTIGANGSARWWNVDTREQRELSGHSNLVAALDFSPRGEWFVTAGDDGVPRVWSTATGALIGRLRGHTGAITSAAFSPDGAYIVTAGADGTARVWAVGADSRNLAELESAGAQPNSATFTPDGASLVTVGGTPDGDASALVWITGAQEPSEWLTDHAGVVRDASFSAGGTFLITAADGSGAHVWQRDGGAWFEATDPIDTPATILSAAISSDGRTAATASDDKRAHLWTREQANQTWHQVKTLSLPIAQTVAFSPDDRSLVAATDRLAVVWNLETMQERARLDGHGDTVRSAVFSPRGDLIVTASDDKTARIWDVASGRAVHELRHEAPVQRAAFSPDGAWVVTVGQNEARVWDVASGALIQTLRVLDDGVVRSAAFSPNGRLLAVAAGDKKVRIFQWEDFASPASLRAEVERRRIAPLSRQDRDRYLAHRESPATQFLAMLFDPAP